MTILKLKRYDKKDKNEKFLQSLKKCRLPWFADEENFGLWAGENDQFWDLFNKVSRTIFNTISNFQYGFKFFNTISSTISVRHFFSTISSCKM